MTTSVRPRSRVPVRAGLIHAGVIARRNMLHFVRIPQLLLFSTVQPVMFLLLFNFVFGGAIETGPGQYINWLIPGILVQSAVFGATATSIGLTEDLAAGVIDRFRSLPMARSAVLAGRTLADLARNSFVFSLMLVVGFLMGWRFEQGFLKMVFGLAIALAFGYSFSWVMATIGLAVKTPEAAQSAGFLPIFPLIFASSIFVPTSTMPGWLQTFAEVQPITVVANTVRSLVADDQVIVSLGLDRGTLILQSFAWIVAILAVFVPLSVRQYKKAVG